MRDIRIKRIEMHNFKGAENMATDFNGGEDTIIAGDNGVGKSRHFDAFTWCLWGKDSLDRKDFEIQTRDSKGDVVHKVTTSVKMTLIISDDSTSTEHTFERKFDENWVKPRGAQEAKLKNRVTSCILDEVPMTVTEYTKRVNEILADDVFKLVSNPMYFATILDWKARRKLILDIAGSKSDEEICEGHDDLKELLARINGVSIADHRRIVAAQRLAAKKELDSIQPRIDQTTKLMPEAQDWDSIQAEIDACDIIIRNADERMSSKNAQASQELARRNAILAQIEALKSTQMDIRVRVEAEAKKAQSEANAQHDADVLAMAKSEMELTTLESSISKVDASITTLASRVEAYNARLNELRAEWHAENEKNESDYICQACGQALPIEKVNTAKAAVKARISKSGKDVKALAETVQKDIDDKRIERDNMALNIEMLRAKINDLRTRTAGYVPTVIEADYKSNEAWIEAEKNINALSESLTDAQEPDMKQDIEEKANAMQKRDSLRRQIADREIIKRYEDEIASLNAKARELVAIIAGLQADEDMIAELQRLRIDECEGRINRMFDNVSFKMFNYTLDGVQEDCCTILVNGVPFESANSTGRINAGLEILEILAHYYDVHAPVWIDNAESYNHIRFTTGQQILLKVTNDKSIKVS